MSTATRKEANHITTSDTPSRPKPHPLGGRVRLAGCLVVTAALAPPVWIAGRLIEGADGVEAVVAPFLLTLWALCSAAMIAALEAHPHPRFGPANMLTALRAAGTVVLAGYALAPEAVAATGRLVPIALAALLLAADGVDGAIARRSGLASPYGARFDVEVDAALTLVLSLLTWRLGHAGPEILFLIAPYYIFCLLRQSLPWLGGSLPPSALRKAVCVLQVATPIALLVLDAPPPIGRALTFIAFAAIFWSFGRDVIRLHRRR
ncbi:phosphatidylglycerophosphate synthase [Palleronia aestuarii]|uniref:Phosphatidylglycerophosphate synthase n=1 Tax=Palleronia aestuarii TaxID=568105 RepID=A0A2W7NMQ8_9RHOB|nr:CDP-alcohol phosphatidyltransferase family protein [Palleronia aestuarii]PZX14466.1 phosphatidylglycerophosphate synthase [Palleronia aestuarii]